MSILQEIEAIFRQSSFHPIGHCPNCDKEELQRLSLQSRYRTIDEITEAIELVLSRRFPDGESMDKVFDQLSDEVGDCERYDQSDGEIVHCKIPYTIVLPPALLDESGITELPYFVNLHFTSRDRRLLSSRRAFVKLELI